MKLDGSLGQLEITGADIPKTAGFYTSTCSSFVFEVVSNANSELQILNSGISSSGKHDDGSCSNGKVIVADSYAGVRRVICKPVHEHYPWLMVVPTTGNISIEIILPHCEYNDV